MQESFREKEAKCNLTYSSLGPVFHACTPENHEIIFTCDKDFSSAMAILAICSRLFPQIRILAFQFMNNHVHFVLCGSEEDIMSFFNTFKYRLRKHFESIERLVNLKEFNLKTFKIDTLEYIRSAIAYNHRNCFIINENITPFSYPWGTGLCYFNKTLLNYYCKCRKQMNVVQVRGIFHSKIADKVKPLFLLDSYVSPLSFCDIQTGESLFSSERQYFYHITKNVESYKRIAETIGDSMYYTDEDLFQITINLIRSKYGNIKPTLLDPNAKIDIAKQLFYDYHAGKKQILRMLKIEVAVLDAILPD